MKIWIALVALVVSFALFAQQGKGHGNKGHGNKGNTTLKFKPKAHGNGVIKQKGNSAKPKMNAHPGKGGPAHGNKGPAHPGNPQKGPQKNAKFQYKKGHVNHVYMYAYGPMHYPTKNYGQWRAQQARNKHKHYHPVLEVDVLNAIVMISDRNTFLYARIGTKIDRYESLVIERHDAGLIADIVFMAHMARIKKYRQTQLQFNIYV